VIELRLEGAEQVRASIREMAKRYPRAMAGAVYKLGIAIFSDALPRVPVEFGVLRASGYVAPPQGEGLEADVELGFGTEYAVPQHERLDYKHPRGGEAKYLERAVSSVAPRALSLLSKWAIELAASDARWGLQGGVNTRPKVGNSNRHKSRSQSARLKKAAANVRRRTGR